MNEFHCQYCGQKINYPLIPPEEKGICPKCKKPFVPVQTKPTYDLTLLDVSEELKSWILQDDGHNTEEKTKEQENEPKEKPPVKEKAAERRFPWFIDIFLYPTSRSGLIHLGIFFGISLLIDIIQSLVPTMLYFLFFLTSAAIYIFLFMYLNWYVAECIRDSADGWVRAPEGLGAMPDLSDMFEKTILIVGCFAFLLGPPILYWIFVDNSGIVFWALVCIALILYPMALLAVVLFDSVAGFSPSLIIRSIYNTFLPYMGLILFIAMSAVVLRKIAATTSTSIIWRFGTGFVIIYMILVCAHLLGRLYWCCEDKLNWNLQDQNNQTGHNS